jgi:hypothetical protein
LVSEALGIDVGEIEGFCRNDDTYRYDDDEGECQIFHTCECEWDTPKSVCVSKYYSTDCEDINNSDASNQYCQTTFNNNADEVCDDSDYFTLSWTGTYYIDNKVSEGVSWCKDGDRRLRCPAKSIVPFFTALTFLVSALAIMVIYFFMRKSK